MAIDDQPGAATPYQFTSPPHRPLGVQDDFILASLERIEAEMIRIQGNFDRLTAILDRVPQMFVPEPCPPHDFPKVWVYRKGDTTPSARHCQKCGAKEDGPPPW